MTKDVLSLLTKKQVEEVYKNHKDEIDKLIMEDFKFQAKRIISKEINNILFGNYYKKGRIDEKFNDSLDLSIDKIIDECRKELFDDKEYTDKIKESTIKKFKIKISKTINSIINYKN